MSKFKLFIQSITCIASTDSGLEGMEDEFYLQVSYSEDNNIHIVEEIELGNFSNGTHKNVFKSVFERDFLYLKKLSFNFYDSDVFSPDDLIGGFSLSIDESLELNSNTVCFAPQGKELPYFILTGCGGNYRIDASFEAN